MNSFKLLFSVSFAILVYITISIIGGQDGILAYNQLEEHKIVLAQNYSALSQTNSQLLIDTMALKEDKTVLASYAKRMGFVHDGEVLMKISGFADSPVFVYNAGSKVLRPEILFISDQSAKFVGFTIFLAMNIMFMLIHVVKKVGAYDTKKIRAECN